MIDKQIIIDGVDVKKCVYHESGYCTISKEAYCYCCDKPNCHYKNWQRKEQECEELKNDNHTLLVTRQKLLNDLWIAEESLKDFKEICDKQCEQFEAYKMEAEEGKEINAELKAENEELTTINARLLGRLEVDETDTSLVFNLDKELRQKEKEFYTAIQKVVKLKQTLTEIKEIVGIGLVDGLQPEEYSGFLKILQAQILQKISECEAKQ